MFLSLLNTNSVKYAETQITESQVWIPIIITKVFNNRGVFILDTQPVWVVITVLSHKSVAFVYYIPVIGVVGGGVGGDALVFFE